jgi:exopolysaccharide biosynthesis polyprenyl glycosylphosphotransferase
MIASDALSGDARDQLTRDLIASGVHVQLVGGLPGIAHRRFRVVPLAHTPSFYIERPALTRVQRALKRGLDVVVAGLALVVLSPLFLAVAVAIVLGDRGPVFYRQTRVGRDGREFEVWKFRTMVPDADAQVAALAAANERRGPLFKVARDPRRTRVGRVLEATSLDELPQLINVVRGEMSLVGPRPALPREVAQFDAELLERLQVLPGITGLWQVEARENPSFGAYRRLDLYYVENWSLGLDLAILAGTVHAVASRITRRKAA